VSPRIATRRLSEAAFAIPNGPLFVQRGHASVDVAHRQTRFAQRSARKQNLHLRARTCALPQDVVHALCDIGISNADRGELRVFESKIKFHTTNACRFGTHELQIPDVKVGRSSIYASLERRLRMMRRHQAIRHVAGQPDTIRPVSQHRCESLRSVVGPTNPRPL
jgi:hypothetical protein